MVVAPEHDLVKQIPVKSSSQSRTMPNMLSRSEVDRMAERNHRLFHRNLPINPIIPARSTNLDQQYVLAGYGTGGAIQRCLAAMNDRQVCETLQIADHQHHRLGL